MAYLIVMAGQLRVDPVFFAVSRGFQDFFQSPEFFLSSDSSPMKFFLSPDPEVSPLWWQFVK